MSTHANEALLRGFDNMEIETTDHHPCFLIVYNISKKHNVGTLARSAAAFGVKEFCLVGSNRYNTFGSHGSSDFVTFKHFTTVKECCTYLIDNHSHIASIDNTAEPIDAEPFSGPTAFMIGNEGTGLNITQREACHRLMYIPQFGSGTASLNVSVACSIVLHRFASWAGYRERFREGGKFDVGTRSMRRHPRGIVPLTSSSVPITHGATGDAASSMDGYQSDCSNSDGASGYLSVFS